MTNEFTEKTKEQFLSEIAHLKSKIEKFENADSKKNNEPDILIDDIAVFKSLINQAGDAIFLSDFDGNILLVNNYATDLLGFSKEEFLNMNVSNLDANFTDTKLQKEYWNKLLPGKIQTLETEHKHKNGSLISVELRIGLFDFDGKNTILGFSRNISDRKESQRAMKNSEERFRTLFEHAPDGIFISDSKGNYLEVNKAGQEMLEYSRDEILNLHISDLIEDFDLPRLPIEIEEVKSRPLIKEWHFKRKDLSTFVGEVYSTVLPDGNILAILRDITERNLAKYEIDLRNSAIENSINGFDMVNEQGEIIYVNKAYVEMWGFSSVDELLGKSPTDHCEDPDIPLEIIKNLKEKGEYALEFNAKRKDGSVFPVFMSTYLVYDSEGKEIYTGSSIDISERKKIEKELAIYREHLEDLVSERTKELEQKNKELDSAMKVFIGRELKIRNLQNRINALDSE